MHIEVSELDKYFLACHYFQKLLIVKPPVTLVEGKSTSGSQLLVQNYALLIELLESELVCMLTAKIVTFP